ncbi:hypothetical protein OF83DRAFT_1172480 [Amylostereum chailletii]|nr:hypothetical protein OF83DRAFT_1172480 [Amylostereum chailletii]
MRFFATVVSVVVAASCAVFVHAAPLQTRQIGNLQCNIARLQIVTDLSKTSDAVKQLSTQVTGTDADSVATAQAGISGAQTAIGGIAKALFTGQAASADLRDQVAGNLTSATTALNSISSTDPTTSSTLSNAISLLGDSTSAGEQVVAQCK